MTTTVFTIVAAYLRERGYDGLCNVHGECGCGLGDLGPCGEMSEECQPAIQVKAPEGATYIPVE